MNQTRINKFFGLGMSFAMLAMLGASANAQEATMQGMIVGRDGPTMYVRTDVSNSREIVVLSDSTKAVEKGGMFGWSHKDLGVAALVPGLEVKVQGSYDADHKLVAKDIEFSRGSLKTAKQIDAGLTPVNAQMAAAQDRLRSDRKDIEQSQQDIENSKKQIADNAALEQQDNGTTNSRIGQLDQYDTKGTFTVSFKNGSAVVSKKDQSGLEDFVKSASGTPGFMIQVQGYASKVGNPSVNQKLSSERADNVLTIIQQSGSVPLTRILAPAAMGTTEQTGDNHTRAGQAENRRVVVTVLVNKGITNGPNASGATAQAVQPSDSATPAPQTAQNP